MPRKKATTAKVSQLVDWRIGHHVEAGAKMIADALNRIAAQMERDHALKAAEVDLRREHLMIVLEQRAMADRAAQKLMGLMPGDLSVVDLRKGKGDEPREEGRGPEWVKDVLAEEAAHTDRQG